MANALRGEATLTFPNPEPEGEAISHTLTFDINALCEAELASGRSTAELISDLDDGPSMLTLRAMLWAALQRRYKCDLLQAGRIIQMSTARVATEAVRTAFVNAFPAPGSKEDGDDESPPTATQVERGTI